MVFPGEHVGTSPGAAVAALMPASPPPLASVAADASDLNRSDTAFEILNAVDVVGCWVGTGMETETRSSREKTKSVCSDLHKE